MSNLPSRIWVAPRSGPTRCLKFIQRGGGVPLSRDETRGRYARRRRGARKATPNGLPKMDRARPLNYLAWWQPPGQPMRQSNLAGDSASESSRSRSAPSLRAVVSNCLAIARKRSPRKRMHAWPCRKLHNTPTQIGDHREAAERLEKLLAALSGAESQGQELCAPRGPGPFFRGTIRKCDSALANTCWPA